MGWWRPALVSLCFCVVGCRSRANPAPSAEPEAGAAPAPPGPPNAVGLPSAFVAAVVNPMNLKPYAGPTGSVEGMVLVRGPDAPPVPDLDVHACPGALDTYGKLFRAGPRRPDGARPLADALVLVTGYSGYVPEKNDVQRVVIGTDCGYPSRAIALTFGQRLDIANDSTLPFAPYLEGAPQLTVMIAPPQQRGEPVKIFPVRADFFPLRDQLQKFVHVDVYVLRQPLHAVTDLQGHFRIDGVPIGKVRVSARLGGLLGEVDEDVDVRADAPQHVELLLKYAPVDAASPPPATPRPSP
ncbi:MAG: carboxypeptidase-like regulatory domain-containing protein [Polyangiaceae bacterium]